jgi:hypothetical protein
MISWPQLLNLLTKVERRDTLAR